MIVQNILKTIKTNKKNRLTYLKITFMNKKEIIKTRINHYKKNWKI